MAININTLLRENKMMVIAPSSLASNQPTRINFKLFVYICEQVLMQSLALDDLLELIIPKTPTYSILDTLMTNSLISIFQRNEQ